MGSSRSAWTLRGVAHAPRRCLLVTANSAYSYPAAIPDGAGGAIIAWVDRRADPDGDIYAQRIDANGVRQWNTGWFGVHGGRLWAVREMLCRSHLRRGRDRGVDGRL